MSQKYVIGLTGNIGTGKSIVRRMLEELGASTIDADSLVHLLQRKGTPVYKKTVETFGTFILDKNGNINRSRLGSIAFSSPEALKTLEAITHPYVRQQIDRVIERAPKYVVVIEAIKLLEGGLAEKCDAIWVVDARPEVQLARLMKKRHMTKQEAMLRIEAQGTQQDKLAKADVVIDNNSDLLSTWNAVQQKFTDIPKPEAAKPATPTTEVSTPQINVEVRRAKRSDLAQMAKLITNGSAGDIRLDESLMMERLFSKGYLLALKDNTILGLIGWRTENLIAGIDDFFVLQRDMWPSVGQVLMDSVEEAVAELSCEAGLIFLHDKTGPPARKLLENRGYQEKAPGALDRMWREAAQEWQSENTTLLVKQLMERRINAPI